MVHGVRRPTPAYQPLRSQHVDQLLDKAGSLLTHSLDLREVLSRLGDLLVPQFADWCNVALLDEQEDEWRLVLTRHADPSLGDVRERVQAAFGRWKNTGSLTQRTLGGGKPLVVETVTEEWLEADVPHPELREIARSLRVCSLMYLPLELDGKLLGSLLLLSLDQARGPYHSEDGAAGRRLATFVAAALRNAKLWAALQDELSERRRIEKIVRAHMSTVRTLAGGLGHDIGNLLQPLRLRLDSLGTMELPRMAVADLKAISGVVAYFQRLTSGLRLLAGDPRGEITSQDITTLGPWWRDVEALMKDALPPGVVLEVSLPPRLPPARIPPAALTHIVFNLVQNAGQGVLGRSRATVRICVERVAKQKTLRISVEDNGPGMDTVTMEHCFDPFYSSVSRAKTTRLGLPLVRALVERVGGQIAVRSSAEGTAFVFTLPLAERRVRRRRSTSLSRVARVTVADLTLARSLRDAVASQGFYVDDTEGLLHGDAQVWITDSGSIGGFEELLEFVVERPTRLVVLITNDRQQAQHPRIHVLEPAVDASRVGVILGSFAQPTPTPAPSDSTSSVVEA